MRVVIWVQRLNKYLNATDAISGKVEIATTESKAGTNSGGTGANPQCIA